MIIAGNEMDFEKRRRENLSPDVEIVDLNEDNPKDCQNLRDFPAPGLSQANGGLLHGKIPFICGGTFGK